MVLEGDVPQGMVPAQQPAGGLEVSLQAAEYRGKHAMFEPGHVDAFPEHEPIADDDYVAVPRPIHDLLPQLVRRPLALAVDVDNIGRHMGGLDSVSLELLGEPETAADRGGEQDRRVMLGVQPVEPVMHSAEDAGRHHQVDDLGLARGPGVLFDVGQLLLQPLERLPIGLVRGEVDRGHQHLAVPQLARCAGLDDPLVDPVHVQGRGRQADDLGALFDMPLHDGPHPRAGVQVAFVDQHSLGPVQHVKARHLLGLAGLLLLRLDRDDLEGGLGVGVGLGGPYAVLDSGLGHVLTELLDHEPAVRVEGHLVAASKPSPHQLPGHKGLSAARGRRQN